MPQDDLDCVAGRIADVPGGRVRPGDLAAVLAAIRRGEGYMAECRKGRGGALFLIENHCPIGAAPEACQGLCAGEITLFRAVLGRKVVVERIEHILAGARRCVYRIAARC